jgi:hypothetical protein
MREIFARLRADEFGATFSAPPLHMLLILSLSKDAPERERTGAKKRSFQGAFANCGHPQTHPSTGSG